jgi:hypothetical protein
MANPRKSVGVAHQDHASTINNKQPAANYHIALPRVRPTATPNPPSSIMPGVLSIAIRLRKSPAAKRCVMMEAAPASPLEMGEAGFAFQFLAVALNASAQFGRVNEDVDGRVFGQGRKPVFCRLFFTLRPFDGSHSSGRGAARFQSREAGRIRTAAKREDKVSLEPSRHRTMRQAGSPIASV